MLLIHSLLQGEQFPNRRSLAEQLEISAKTVQRDIDFMRERLGLPIEYHDKKYGYYYSEKVFGFPNIEITENEILALIMADKALTLIEGSGLEKNIQSAFGKVLDQLKSKIDNDLDDFQSSFSFKSTGTSLKTDSKLTFQIWQAITNRREMEFEYRNLKNDHFEPRRVQPYHLAWIDQKNYLFAYDPRRKGFRTFALLRMRNVISTEVIFKRDSKFSIKKHLKDSFGVSTNSGIYKVRLRFDPLAARLIQEKIWHPTQVIKPLRNGGIEMEMTLGSLAEVKRWILSWGKSVQVLGPQKLISRLNEDVSEMAEFYLRPKPPGSAAIR
jgi:proteasome accessory factor B